MARLCGAPLKKRCTAWDTVEQARSPDAAQRAVLRGAVRCRAGAPVSFVSNRGPVVSRSGIKNAASRPGNETISTRRRGEGRDWRERHASIFPLVVCDRGIDTRQPAFAKRSAAFLLDANIQAFDQPLHR